MPTSLLPLYGLILAGGKSSRMGFDKAQLNFHGAPQVSWLFALLEKYCDKVFVSGSQAKIQGHFECIEDYYQRGGPLNGILSAHRLYPGKAWLVLPVDMPFVDDDVITFLMSQRNPSKAATCFINPNANQIEPFPLILEPAAYRELQLRFEKADESVSRFLKTTNAVKVTARDARWLQNVNDPSQL